MPDPINVLRNPEPAIQRNSENAISTNNNGLQKPTIKVMEDLGSARSSLTAVHDEISKARDEVTTGIQEYLNSNVKIRTYNRLFKVCNSAFSKIEHAFNVNKGSLFKDTFPEMKAIHKSLELSKGINNALLDVSGELYLKDGAFSKKELLESSLGDIKQKLSELKEQSKLLSDQDNLFNHFCGAATDHISMIEEGGLAALVGYDKHMRTLGSSVQEFTQVLADADESPDGLKGKYSEVENTLKQQYEELTQIITNHAAFFDNHSPNGQEILDNTAITLNRLLNRVAAEDTKSQQPVAEIVAASIKVDERAPSTGNFSSCVRSGQVVSMAEIQDQSRSIHALKSELDIIKASSTTDAETIQTFKEKVADVRSKFDNETVDKIGNYGDCAELDGLLAEVQLSVDELQNAGYSEQDIAQKITSIAENVQALEAQIKDFVNETYPVLYEITETTAELKGNCGEALTDIDAKLSQLKQGLDTFKTKSGESEITRQLQTVFNN